MGKPPNHPFFWEVFPYKPSILGYHYFWKHLVGGFNPLENISQIGSLPQFSGWTWKKMKSPPRYCWCFRKSGLKSWLIAGSPIFSRVWKLSQLVMAGFLKTIKNTSSFLPSSFRETTIKLLLKEISRLPLDHFSIHCHDFFWGRAKKTKKKKQAWNKFSTQKLTSRIGGISFATNQLDMVRFTLPSLLTKILPEWT